MPDRDELSVMYGVTVDDRHEYRIILHLITTHETMGRIVDHVEQKLLTVDGVIGLTIDNVMRVTHDA